MARGLARLTALAAAKAKAPGAYADGGGLYLQITPSGVRSWLFRFMLNGRAREMGLGPLHSVTLAEARQKAAECRRLRTEGVDPIESPRQGSGGYAARSSRSLTDTINHAKQNPGRGKWGAASPGSLERIALETMNRMTGARAAVVPHDGGGDMIINILNGTLDIGVGEIQEISTQLQTDKVRLLGVLTDKRITQFPNLPTAKEQGINLVVSKFRGLAGPKNLPANVVLAWETAVPKILANPAYRKYYEQENLVPEFKGQKDSRELTAAFANETAKSLRELGIIK